MWSPVHCSGMTAMGTTVEVPVRGRNAASAAEFACTRQSVRPVGGERTCHSNPVAAGLFTVAIVSTLAAGGKLLRVNLHTVHAPRRHVLSQYRQSEVRTAHRSDQNPKPDLVQQACVRRYGRRRSTAVAVL